ncbi:TerD family protein [Escherichia coli]|uniref:TerD family protein n=1 Tax=Escherichia coli TaxID=562 RepID=UPI002882D9B4|nr:TerD family protein [Escherichia coli]
MSVGSTHHLEVVFVWKQNYILVDEYFFFCCTWIVNSAFNNKTSPDGAVEHQGDNRTGEGDGDDEQVKIDLTKVSADIKKLVFAVTIYDAEARKQNFGMVSNSFMRVYNNDNGTEIARFDLSEDASTETAMVFGELYRHGAEWKFKAVGQGFAGGLAALASQHGVNI